MQSPEPGPNPYASPAASVLEDEPPELVEIRGERALKWAAVMMLVNSVLVVAENIVLHDDKSGPTMGGFFPAVIDAVIAASFLRGEDRYKGWAILRIVLGVLIGSGRLLASGETFGGLASAAGYGGLLLVLVGHATRGRVIAGTLIFGVFVALEVAGLVITATGGG